MTLSSSGTALSQSCIPTTDMAGLSIAAITLLGSILFPTERAETFVAVMEHQRPPSPLENSLASDRREHATLVACSLPARERESRSENVIKCTPSDCVLPGKHTVARPGA